MHIRCREISDETASSDKLELCAKLRYYSDKRAYPESPSKCPLVKELLKVYTFRNTEQIVLEIKAKQYVFGSILSYLPH